METSYADTWSDMAHLVTLTCGSWNEGQHDLYSTVQWFSCVLKTIWYMNIIIWDYESVWPDVWPQSKRRSLWRIFHDPVNLRYILKNIWCMYIILWDYGSVWPDIWPYFLVQWFCIISQRLFDGWVSYFRKKRQGDPNFDLKINLGQPIFHGLVILLNIFKIIWCMNIMLGIMDQCGTKIDLIE